MEDSVRALQQQVNALMSQNAALEAQLISQQNIAQGLAELPGAIKTVLNRSQAPTRRMLVDPKGLGKPPVFWGREEHYYVWTKKVENYVSGVFPIVRGALAFAAESQDVVTAATVAMGVPELGVETSAEVDGVTWRPLWWTCTAAMLMSWAPVAFFFFGGLGPMRRRYRPSRGRGGVGLRRWPPLLPAFEFFLALLSMIFLTFILLYMIFLTVILFLLIIIFVANVLRLLADRHLVCHMVLCPTDRPTDNYVR